MFSRKGFFVIPLRSLFCGMALFLVLIAGCSSGPKLVKANGQLLYNSKPLSVDPNTKISVFFVSMGEEAATFTADPFDRDESTFIVSGRTGQGIPVGKYRIAVRQIGDLSDEAERINEMFTRKNSPIIREVTSEEPIILDLSKPEG